MKRFLLSSALRRSRRITILAVVGCFSLGLLVLGLRDPEGVVAWVAGAPHAVVTLVVGAVAVLLVLSLIALFSLISISRRNLRISMALDNMSQGLCMFNRSSRLVICNERYLEMYSIPRKLAQPGASLRELLQARIESGTFSGDPAAYVAHIERRVAEGKPFSDVIKVGDRDIAISGRLAPGGGWVSTHDDISDRQRQNQERSAVAAQEERRAAVEAAIAVFRPRVETMLKSVSEHANAMRSTASALFAASSKASQRAEGASDTSSRASMNVEIVAGAATTEEVGALVFLIERDGMAWGSSLQLRRGMRSIRIPLRELKPMRAAMLPRDFPVGINPYFLRPPNGRGGGEDRVDLSNLQAVQVTVRKGAGGGGSGIAEFSRISVVA